MDDMMNDAIDAQIQAALQRSRGNALEAMRPAMAQATEEPEDQSMYEQMVAEDMAANSQPKSGGGGLGAIAGKLLGG
ncbi:MAG: hypothetical protein SFW67_28370 [Myxococcaceae bacterium]|nr:hypothetical protein [Myxococcaceae bacterium]